MTPDQPQSQFGSTANDMREYATGDRAREYGRYADETVQQNPWAAVGVGFGAVMGALLMLAARR